MWATQLQRYGWLCGAQQQNDCWKAYCTKWIDYAKALEVRLGEKNERLSEIKADYWALQSFHRQEGIQVGKIVLLPGGRVLAKVNDSSEEDEDEDEYTYESEDEDEDKPYTEEKPCTEGQAVRFEREERFYDCNCDDDFE